MSDATTHSGEFGDVTITDNGVRINALADQLSDWANRPGAVWPCSELEELDSISVHFDANGLVDIGVERYDDFSTDIPGDELTAWSSDVLRDVLPIIHPAWFVTVGQFIDESTRAAYALRDDRRKVIEIAQELDQATFDAESCAVGPGRYEGTNDLSLVVALDIIYGHGFADDQAGDVDSGLHLARVGRFVMMTDDRGFVDVSTFDSEDAAQAALDERDAESNKRYASAIILTIESTDETSAWETIAQIVNDTFHDTDISAEFCGGAFPVPADHDPDNLDWAIDSVFYAGRDVRGNDDNAHRAWSE